MGTTTYYEEPIFPVGDDGLANSDATPTTIEVLVSNFDGNHQVYLTLHEGEPGGDAATLHLTKLQARALAEALNIAESTITYDNTTQTDDD